MVESDVRPVCFGLGIRRSIAVRDALRHVSIEMIIALVLAFGTITTPSGVERAPGEIVISNVNCFRIKERWPTKKTRQGFIRPSHDDAELSDDTPAEMHSVRMRIAMVWLKSET